MPLNARSRLPPTVIGLGLVSLLTDASSELIFPLLPAFLTTLGASNAFIGAVEGVADLVANALKYFSGLAADRRARLKPLVLAGYGLSTIVRPLVAFAAAPWHVMLVRVGDRVGKGVRSSPRDALIAGATEPGLRARAYGFHRAMDHAGAAIGTLLASGLLWLLGSKAGTTDGAVMRQAFLYAAIPGFLALVALALTPEPVRAAPVPSEDLRPLDRRPSGLDRRPSGLDRRPSGRQALAPGLKRAMVALALFAFANATDAFVLVKATRLGAAPALLPLLWLALHVVKAATATAGGGIADRFGRRNALALGWTVYGLTWGAVGFAESIAVLFVLTAVYGVSHGLVEGAERALVAELSEGHAKGRAFGAYNMLIGFSALAASVAFGAVWDRWGSVPAFVGSGSVALVAAGLLLALVRDEAR